MSRTVEVDFHGRRLSHRDRPGRQAGRRLRAGAVRRDRRPGDRDRQPVSRGRASISSRSPATTVEKTFAAGKIPGGFFKREGRPAEKEILTSRLIDRPIRPLFPKGFHCETQVIATVLSHDQENDPDMIAIVGASTALTLSDIPFNGPIAAVRVGRVGGKFVINPTTTQLEESDLNLIVAASRDAIVMVEGGARMLPETRAARGALRGARRGAAADRHASGSSRSISPPTRTMSSRTTATPGRGTSQASPSATTSSWSQWTSGFKDPNGSNTSFGAQDAGSTHN